MENQTVFQKTAQFMKVSAGFKVCAIAFLVLILQIPAAMVSDVIYERQSRRNSVVSEINEKWGQSQTVTGPILSVPYKSYYKDEKNNILTTIYYAHFLPKELNISGDVKTEIRYRSIFEAVLYNTKITVNGFFEFPDIAELSVDSKDVLWEKAFISLGIHDMKGIKEHVVLFSGGKKYPFNPGIETQDVIASGISTKIPLDIQSPKIDFLFDLNLNGSEELQFVPVGETTGVQLASKWKDPSFSGAFLPAERTINDNGFIARWNVIHLNRNYPQSFLGRNNNLSQSSFGVKLIIAADIYQRTIRTTKYALLFLVFTFSAFFFAEILNRKRIHSIQYILIGLAIILFYILVVSLSEYIQFNNAYIISSTAVILMISAYTSAIIKNRRFTLTVLGILVILYSYLYIVLQLEDYALIMGSTGLFCILGTIMYISRKINWYSLDFEE